MKILITGGAGFIGSHVTKQLLDNGHETIVFDDLSRGFRRLVDPRSKFVQASILEKPKLIPALSSVEVVIHMAAFIIVPESVEKPDLYHQNNVVGSQILLSAMKEAGVKKLIFSSSATVYGSPDTLPLTENSPVKKASNPYGQTKIDMEKMIEKEVNNGWLHCTILRYFNPYGPGEMHDPETHAIPNIIKSALKNEPVPLYWRGEQVRDFIYIDDLAAAHIAPLLLEGLNIFNVGTGEGTKIIDIVKTISKILGREVKIEDLGERVGDVPALFTSNEKISTALGWKAVTSLEEGLRKTINFYRTLA